MGPRSSTEDPCILGEETSLIASARETSCGIEQTHKESRRSTWFRAITWKILVVIIIIFVGACSATVLASFWRYLSPTEDSGRNSSVSDDRVCKNDVLDGLRKQATVENAQHAAVASDHPICSRLGMAILRDHGGNAVDAAAATTLCLGVANPVSSGLGGGGFILVHTDGKVLRDRLNDANFTMPQFRDAREPSVPVFDDDGKVTEAIDCREVAPAAAYRDMYLNGSSTVGGLAIGVPGELRGLELMHARHGRLSWSEVVEPVLALVRQGVKVGPTLASDIHRHTKGWTFDGPHSILTKHHAGKARLCEGDVLKMLPQFEDTLEAIQLEGADALYKGKRAKLLAKDMQDAGGIITEEDISSYYATLRNPAVSDDIYGFTVVGVPPPSSGGATIIGILRFLSGFKTPLAAFSDTLSIHFMVEAMRHAFAIRMSLADPAFSNVTAAAVNDLVSGSYIEQLRQQTRENETLPISSYGGQRWGLLNDGDGENDAEDAHEGDRRRRRRLLGHADVEEKSRRLARRFGYLEDRGTTHLSIVDVDGNAVSITSSVNSYFGSGVVSPSTGIAFLNNQMDDFATPGKANYYGLEPAPQNFVAPFKKPLSSMSPTMVFRKGDDAGVGGTASGLGSLVMVLGGSGGPKIINAVVQVFVNHLLLGKSLFDSMANPRVHDQLLYHNSGTSTVERSRLDNGYLLNVSNRTRQALERRKHRLLEIDYTGCVQAVSIDQETGLLSAVSDIRKGGSPAAY
mmetsp:Transcript_49656/g.74000  ORF Transcript_49656/g.74000 Transcript_49656/m.74000 type:complete len:743 (-) Transcript_49656:1054-3282(-)|eukprot:CAMPEP_0194031078 /NCGR_PEP_ID=MMETSP0009_2-20130614/4348_1 /TAXON_ID=210454 /ORGANISM="Grammatophora oceanica, Strain CCMP 410" /LENGTH=742 /DNA_ID=CAMNT_0038671145 /DNA_START=151 /DNA_END=2379 /DNA_ORIENTATION=+